jgi:arabinan endo-1,5-alpha-L-arabinosidase
MRRAVVGGVTALVIVAASGVSSAATRPVANSASAAAATTYTNPISAGTVDTFPDPAMIRGKDGYWYAYGTTNPILFSKGDGVEHTLPMLRSPDMMTWTYVGDAYTVANQALLHYLISGRVEPWLVRGQIAWASSVNAAATRLAGGASSPSS